MTLAMACLSNWRRHQQGGCLSPQRKVHYYEASQWHHPEFSSLHLWMSLLVARELLPTLSTFQVLAHQHHPNQGCSSSANQLSPPRIFSSPLGSFALALVHLSNQKELLLWAHQDHPSQGCSVAASQWHPQDSSSWQHLVQHQQAKEHLQDLPNFQWLAHQDHQDWGCSFSTS